MTIAQQFLGKKPYKQQEEPLVPAEKTPTIKDAEEGRPVVVTMHSHVRRVNSLTTICVFVTALLVFTTGIIGGVYLYRQFSHYKLRHFRGWCSIPYLPDVLDEPPKHEPMVASQTSTKADSNAVKTNFFEEEFDIDIKFEEYERIEVPRFAYGKRAQFIHDFVVNRTAIVDYDNRRCFLMILNRNFVLPPRPLYDQVTKMRAGYFNGDTSVVRHNMQAVTPSISDMKHVGIFIARDCATMPIYMLQKAHTVVVKRSIEEKREKDDMFVEFAGVKVNEYNIVNLKDAVPGESL